MRDGVIEDVGPLVAAPADALLVDGSGLVVYPGLIDMSNPSLVEARTSVPAAPAPAAQGGRGRGAAVATPDSITWADQEREARTRFLHPDVDAAALVEFEGDDLRRLAAAGITSALAVPSQGIIRGQSARERHGPSRSRGDQRACYLSSRPRRRAGAGRAGV